MLTRKDMTWTNSSITDIGRIRVTFMGKSTKTTERPTGSSKW